MRSIGIKLIFLIGVHYGKKLFSGLDRILIHIYKSPGVSGLKYGIIFLFFLKDIERGAVYYDKSSVLALLKYVFQILIRRSD